MSARKYLGRDLTPILWILIGYRSVFEIEDGLEVDEINLAIVERTRVYFDDVVGITYHRVPGVGFLIFTGLLTFLLGAIGLTVILNEEPVAGIVVAGAALPFLIAFVLRLILKVSIVTVFGRRTMACIKIPLRNERARQLYRDLTLKIRACQEKAAAALPKPVPPPAAPEPPAPTAP